MGSSVIKRGESLVLDGNTIDILGNKGFVDGDRWCMNVFFGAFAMVTPKPASPDIERIIADDLAAGQKSRIDHIRVNPNTAVRLFLEGRIARNHVMNADVKDDEKSITFHDVKFDCEGTLQPFKVVVLPQIIVDQTEITMATFDREGNVV